MTTDVQYFIAFAIVNAVCWFFVLRRLGARPILQKTLPFLAVFGAPGTLVLTAALLVLKLKAPSEPCA